MARYISATDTGKLIRKALKAAFPGTKFSVRTDRGSARIAFTDGPALDAVRAVADKFRGASFDGMIDLESIVTGELDGEAVHFGTKYIFVNRRLSVAFLRSMVDQINPAKADTFEISEDSSGATLQFVGDFDSDWADFLSVEHWVMQAARETAA